MDLGDLLGGDADVGALIVSGHRFTTAEQGVTAQRYDDTHGACPSNQRRGKQLDLPVGTGIPCGSEPAREGVRSVDISVE
jgi:hypothetical protein